MKPTSRSKKICKCSLQVLLLAVTNVLAGCSDSKPGDQSNKYQPLTNLNSQQKDQQWKAIEVRDKLFAGLLRELTNTMAQKGPAKSISVCKTIAPELAKKVSDETGVKIGRTSFKLRNQDNSPPEWAAGFVNDHIADQVEIALSDDRLGVLVPIRLKSTCLLCHGPRENLMPDVKAAIASNYPDDQATGFSEGDLRGYFWIEVPKM